ncbi:MAG: hypothetical protein OHK0029_18180 [Armatimonadaceae bacterium]
MGKRGPKAGTKYRKRIAIPRPLPVGTDHQLVLAQHFNDRLYEWMRELEQCERFPLNALEPVVLERVLEATAALQGAVVQGIANYLVEE